MKRLMVGVVAVLLFTGIAQAQRRPGDGRPAPSPAAGDALAGLTAAQRTLFADGLEDFSEEETVNDGLGPVFNERSCAACHSVPAIGGGSTRTVTRFSKRTNGIYDAMIALGGSLMQDHAIGLADGSPHTFNPETVPALATLTVHRRTPPLFGLGLVDATPDSDFISMAAMRPAKQTGSPAASAWSTTSAQA